MSAFKNLKKNIIDPILKNDCFAKVGKVWYKKNESNIVCLIEINNRTVAEDSFSVTINNGIYYTGLIELLYGFPYKHEDGIVNCIYKGAMRKMEIKQYFDTKDYHSIEDLSADVLYSLKNTMLPFLNSITNGEELLALFQENISYYIENDSILALQIACLYFLLGKKERGKEIVLLAIAHSKTKYEFAEKLLSRMEGSSK